MPSAPSPTGPPGSEEALELKRFRCPLLIFNPLSREEAEVAVRHGFRVSVVGREDARAVAEIGRSTGSRAVVHLKVNTGLGRYGAEPEEVPELVQELLTWPGLEVEGLYTHLADSLSRPPRASRRQLEIFEGTLEALEARGLYLPIRHALDSGGLLAFPGSCYDMVRIGNLLYGLDVAGDAREKLDLRDPWALKARLGQVRSVAKGTPVGYGWDFRAPRDMRVAVLPVGYHHGLGLEPVSKTYRFSNILRNTLKRLILRLRLAGVFGVRACNGYVEVCGRPAPIVGRVFMGHALIDVTDIPEAEPGAVATLSVPRSLVNPRLARVYFQGGQALRIRSAAETEPLEVPSMDRAVGG